MPNLARFKAPSVQLTGLARQDSEDETIAAKYRAQLTAVGDAPRARYLLYRMPEKVLAPAAKKFEGVRAFAHQHGEHVPVFARSTQDAFGEFRNARYNKKTKTMDADLTVLNTELGREVMAKLDYALANNPKFMQFSMDFAGQFSTRETKTRADDGNPMWVETVTKLDKVFSVDLVTEGAFPMKAIRKLSADGQSEWVTDTSSPQEAEMAEKGQVAEQGVEEKDQTPEQPSMEQLSKDVAELRTQLAAQQETAAETETETETETEQTPETETEQTETLTAEQQELAEIRKTLSAITAINMERDLKAHFESATAQLNANHPSVLALKNSIDFTKSTKDEIDRMAKAVVASLTAEGREHMQPTIKVTGDVATKHERLADAFIQDRPIKEGDLTYQPFQTLDQLRRATGDNRLLSATELWNEMLVEHRHQQLAISTTGTSWGKVVLESIIQAVGKNYAESKFMETLRMLIPSSHMYDAGSLADEKYLAISGVYGETGVVVERAEIPEMTSPGGYRVPLKPARYPRLETISLEQWTSSPVQFLRQIPMKLANGAVRTLYNAVMTIIFGSGSGSFTEAKEYESDGTLDATAALYQKSPSTRGVNLVSTNAAANNFSYDNLVAMRQRMFATQMFGETEASLAGIINPKFLVVPPQRYDNARTFSESDYKPGASTFELNLLSGMTPVPANLAENALSTGTSAVPTTERYSVLADPMTTQLFACSFLDGQRAPVARPVTTDKEVTHDIMTWRLWHTWRVEAVDWRGFQLQERV